MPGENAPTSIQDMQANFWNPDYQVQIVLELEQLSTGKERRNIWLQYLLDATREVCIHMKFELVTKTIKFRNRKI